MGKFDKKRHHEPEMKLPRGKRHKVRSASPQASSRQVAPAVGTSDELKSEKQQKLAVLDRMMRGEASSAFNADKAANYQQVEDERAGRTKKAKAGGDGKKRRSQMGKPVNAKGRKMGALKKKG